MPEQSDRFNHVLRSLVADLRGVPDNTPPRQRKRPTHALSSLIEELLAKHQIGQTTPEHAIRERWASLVGPAIAHYSHAALIDPKGRLTILYNQPVAGNELRFRQSELLEKIRVLPGCAHIKGLNIRAG
jgi:hypothetical protein